MLLTGGRVVRGCWSEGSCSAGSVGRVSVSGGFQGCLSRTARSSGLTSRGASFFGVGSGLKLPVSTGLGGNFWTGIPLVIGAMNDRQA